MGLAVTARIDAHQHFWRLARGDYAWLTRELTPLYRDFLPADLEPLLDDRGIAATVLVQAAPTDQETDFLLAVAEQTEYVAGVVGWVDMEDPGASDRLAVLAEHPAFLGVRPMIQDIADRDWMLRPQLQPAFDALQALDLAFDALVRPEHLDNLHRLLERHPKLRLVIDHGAKPDIASSAFAPWAEKIDALARYSDACCKLSGLVTEAGPDWHERDVVPYMDCLLERFGASRLMWGSDWPVVNLAGGYARWWALTNDWIDRLDAGDRDQVLGGTATAFYRLRTEERPHD